MKINPPGGGGGGKDGSVIERRIRGLGFEGLQERWYKFLLQGHLSSLTLITVSLLLPCYRSST